MELMKEMRERSQSFLRIERRYLKALDERRKMFYFYNITKGVAAAVIGNFWNISQTMVRLDIKQFLKDNGLGGDKRVK